jgi:hypothetical protein
MTKQGFTQAAPHNKANAIARHAEALSARLVFHASTVHRVVSGKLNPMDQHLERGYRTHKLVQELTTVHSQHA